MAHHNARPSNARGCKFRCFSHQRQKNVGLKVYAQSLRATNRNCNASRNFYLGLRESHLPFPRRPSNRPHPSLNEAHRCWGSNGSFLARFGLSAVTDLSPQCIPRAEVDQPMPTRALWRGRNVLTGCRVCSLPQLAAAKVSKSYFGQSRRISVEIDGDVTTSPVCDSYGPFLYGCYRLYTLGKRFFREVGQKPIVEPNSTRETINETIDVSVFQRWANDETYRPQNLDDWATRYSLDPAKISTSVLAHDGEPIPLASWRPDQ
jgi:hypothetical protein